MGRQRTINDQRFWSSPKMSRCTIEDRFALFYLLTCPASNIIGCYAITPRIAAAEVGWDTESQFLPVLRRLAEGGFIKYDADTCFVWVRIWWEHHHPKVAMGPTLCKKTMKQIRAMPISWTMDYLDDLLTQLHEYRDPKDSKDPGKILIDEFSLGSDLPPDPQPSDRVSTPYQSPIDTPDGNSNDNNTCKSINTTTNSSTSKNETLYFPSKLKEQELLIVKKQLEKITTTEAQDILDEMAAAMNHNKIEKGAIQWLSGVMKNHELGIFKLTSAGKGIKQERTQLQFTEETYINRLPTDNDSNGLRKVSSVIANLSYSKSS